MELSKRTLKQMRNLESFCDFDTRGAVATLHLRFQTLSEIVDENRGSAEEPVLRAEAIDLLKTEMERVPKEFKVNFEIEIADDRDYDPQLLERTYSRAMEIKDYRRKTHDRQKRSQMAKFVLLGSGLMLFVILNSKYKWFSSAGLPFSFTIAYLLELIFEVYFEEGMTHFFVTSVYERFDRNHRFGAIQISKH